MNGRRTRCYEQALACDLFDKFCNANVLKDILRLHEELCRVCSLSPTSFSEFFPKIKEKVPSWKANDLWTKIEKRVSQTCYVKGTACRDTRVLIIGAGPCGIRAAIEAQLLGCKTVVVEKRSQFSRNNIIHLWPFTITDLKNLGAKVFCPRFCAGSIDHISIRQLQCVLLKIALLIGVEVLSNVSFEGLAEPRSEHELGWKAFFCPENHPVHHFKFDVVIGADGRRSTLPGFQRKALRAKLAIAITANFIRNPNDADAEAKVPEISGVSYIFKQQFFTEMDAAFGIALENIVYYKDETHYFVMTPTKQSLLEKGVLCQDFPDPEQLLSPENVDQEALQKFTIQAVVFATDNRLPNLQFATNSRGKPDLEIFDFTSIYASENSCRAIARKGNKLLLALVGDALLEPFWPTGSGIGRGFLSAFDAAWMIRSWGKGIKSICEVLAERESIHRVLAQTTHENLNKDHNQYSIDPMTRYPNINLNSVGAHQVKYLFDSDEQVENIFLSIRDSKRSKLVPEQVMLLWFQEHLIEAGIYANSLLDVFTDGRALIEILKRFRPDLVMNVNIEDIAEESGKVLNNRFALQTFMEEFNIPIVIDGENSVKVRESDMTQVVQHLSQVYNVFNGEIPKHGNFEGGGKLQIEEIQSFAPYPNNSSFHHNLSIKQFLKAKEELEKKKAEADAKSKMRSQIYESIMLSESNSPQRSTLNIPPRVKIEPLPASELFSACRNGSDREKSTKPKIPTDTISMINLARSRSNLGHVQTPTQYITNRKINTLSNLLPPSPSKLSGLLLETEDVRSSSVGQFRVKSPLEKSEHKKCPLGNIVSTFMGKHINQNSRLSNEESDENPLSSEPRLLSPTEPGSTYQNANDQEPFPPDPTEDQENVEQRDPNPFFNNYEQDPGFKERCKFLEKRLYNSGRDIKINIGASWFKKPEGSLEKSQTSLLTLGSAGSHPLTRGSCLTVKNKMEEQRSFNNKKEARRGEKEKQFNPTALFLERKLGKIVDRLGGASEWRSGEKSPKPKNDHNSHPTNFHRHQQSGIVTRVGNPSNKDKSQKEEKISEASASVVDSDLDCFLNAIDFNGIDGQDLQELLSSF